MRLNTSVVFLARVTGDDLLCSLFSRRPYMVHRPKRVGTVGSCIAFEEDSPGVFHEFFSRKNTQAMQDPPELINVQTVGTVRFW